MELHRALHTTIRGNQKCGDYFEQMKCVANQLTVAGDLVLDSDLVCSILSGLGAEYNSFVVVITTRSAHVSLVDLHTFLLSHESLLTSQTPFSSNYADPVMLYAGHGRGRGRRGRGNSNFSSNVSQGPRLPNLGRGYGNSGPNRASDCSGPVQDRGNGFSSGRAASSISQSSQFTGDKPQCQIYRKKGHEALECRYRFENDAYASPPQPFFNTTASTLNE